MAKKSQQRQIPRSESKREPKQPRLPGTEDPEIQELESLAEEYAEMRDRRQELTPLEVALKEKLLAAMKRHRRQTYRHAGVSIEVVAVEETVKVRIAKEPKAKEAAAGFVSSPTVH